MTQDPIGLAGGVNLYAYAGNNPVAFRDPYGLCPGKARSGTICVSFFIREPTTMFELLKGDGRGFDPFSKPEQSRAYAIINPEAPDATKPVINETCSAGGTICAGPLNTNRFSVRSDGDSGFNVSVDITNALIPGPSINANLNFSRNADGEWHVNGTRDGYPSFEAYYYDENGNVQIIKRQGEGKPRQLWGDSDTKVQGP